MFNKDRLVMGLAALTLFCAAGALVSSCEEETILYYCHEHSYLDSGLHYCVCRNEWLAEYEPTVLNCNGVTSIGSFSGIEEMQSLASINLENVYVTELSHVGLLANLQSLWLKGSPVVDTSFLTSLVKMRALGMVNSGLTDVTHMAGLTNLIGLDLSRNRISDVTPLAGLTNLHTLELRDNTSLEPNEDGELEILSGLDALASLTHLKRLDLGASLVDCVQMDALQKSLPSLVIDKDPGCVPQPVANVQVTDFVVTRTELGYAGTFTLSWGASFGADRYHATVSDTLEDFAAGASIWYQEIPADLSTTYTLAGQMDWDLTNTPDFSTYMPVFAIVAVSDPAECETEECSEIESKEAFVSAKPTVAEEE